MENDDWNQAISRYNKLVSSVSRIPLVGFDEVIRITSLYMLLCFNVNECANKLKGKYLSQAVTIDQFISSIQQMIASVQANVLSDEKCSNLYYMHTVVRTLFSVHYTLDLLTSDQPLTKNNVSYNIQPTFPAQELRDMKRGWYPGKHEPYLPASVAAVLLVTMLGGTAVMGALALPTLLIPVAAAAATCVVLSIIGAIVYEVTKAINTEPTFNQTFAENAFEVCDLAKTIAKNASKDVVKQPVISNSVGTSFWAKQADKSSANSKNIQEVKNYR